MDIFYVLCVKISNGLRGIREGVSVMICKYCGETMEFDSSEGIGHSEVHHYECIMCKSSVTVHENGEEDTWEHGGK